MARGRIDDAGVQLWRNRLLPHIVPRLFQEALDRTEQGGFETLTLSDKGYPNLFDALGDNAPKISGSKVRSHFLRRR